MDQFVIVLFAYNRLENTKLQWQALINKGVQKIYVFQDYHHEGRTFEGVIPIQVTIVRSKRRLGQFRNYHLAFLKLRKSYKWVFVFEDDLDLKTMCFSSLHLDSECAHLNIGLRHPNLKPGEISTWGYGLNLQSYPAMFNFSLLNLINTLISNGRIYRRNFGVQLVKSLLSDATWGLCWQMYIDSSGLSVGDVSNQGVVPFANFYGGENIKKSKLTNRIWIKNIVLNTLALTAVILYPIYNKRIKKICAKF